MIAAHHIGKLRKGDRLVREGEVLYTYLGIDTDAGMVVLQRDDSAQTYTCIPPWHLSAQDGAWRLTEMTLADMSLRAAEGWPLERSGWVSGDLGGGA